MIESPRLVMRRLTHADASFIVELLTDPGYLRWIGDKGVHTEADARRYLDEGPLASYATHGHGLYHVARRDDGTAVGYCGLLRRSSLPCPDLGFAMLPACRGQGYTVEASKAVLAHEHATLGITRVGAIILPGNAASIGVVERLGFRPAGTRSVEPDPTILLWYERSEADTDA